MAVEWFETDVAPDLRTLLVDYDHHQFPLDDRAAVLITYLEADERGQAASMLHAVRHDAADRHPALPDRLIALVDTLEWRSSPPPPAPA